MLSSERQLAIINIISENKAVEVETLAKKLGVSGMTIRRDLKKLNDSGLIERCYGGAISSREVTYDIKRIENSDIKQKIAAVAVKYVRNGMTVFLDAGTTTYEIAQKIKKMKNLTIATNDMEIGMLLTNSDCNLIICGGGVQKSTKSIYGYYAIEMMKNFRFDIGFFGAASINSSFQVMTPTIDKAFLKKTVASQCKVSILTVDSSKFNKDALHMVHNLSDFTAVITDKVFTPDEDELLIKHGIRIIDTEE